MGGYFFIVVLIQFNTLLGIDNINTINRIIDFKITEIMGAIFFKVVLIQFDMRLKIDRNFIKVALIQFHKRLEIDD